MNILFGSYNIKLKKVGQDTKIFDIVRNKWIVLTPEEQVRQVWIHYLIYDLGFSPSNLAVEKLLRFNGKNKRFDICIYNQNADPEILIECKSPKIILDTSILEQLSIYNSQLKTQKFVISNGITHRGYQIIDQRIEPLLYLEKNNS